MAGHSKWANIKRRKEKVDAIKGKLFSRVTKEIMTAVRHGGSDPKSNLRLKVAIQKARVANLPRETIERNIKKAASADSVDFSEILYEIYGYGGVGILVEVSTDNKNRIASDVRIVINKKGGNIATPGAVAFNFDRKGVVQIPRTAIAEEMLFSMAMNLGVDDFEVEESVYVITTSPDQLYRAKEELEQQGVLCDEASLERIPKSYVVCSTEDQEANIALIDGLENTDDVDAVYHNMEL